MFLTQETELMRCRLLNAPSVEIEQMIKQYPKYLPLKRATIPAMEELEKRKRRGAAISEEDALLSMEVDMVYRTVTTKEEKHSYKFEREYDRGSYWSKRMTAEQTGIEFYQVC